MGNFITARRLNDFGDLEKVTFSWFFAMFCNGILNESGKNVYF